MAGSYKHVTDGFSLIENMGDAYEAVEELFYLVRCFATDAQIESALEYFYERERGELKENWLREAQYGPAYEATKEVMDK